jgi:hypothetical protein
MILIEKKLKKVREGLNNHTILSQFLDIHSKVIILIIKFRELGIITLNILLYSQEILFPT